MDNPIISKCLSENESFIVNKLGKSGDVVFRYLVIPALETRQAFLCYIDGLVGANEMDSSILQPLMSLESLPAINNEIDEEIVEGIMKSRILVPSVKKALNLIETLDCILSGDTALFIDDSSNALILSTRGWKSRSLSEPSNESSIRGAKDAFIETLRSNTALIRRRIKDYDLRFDSLKIGERSKTDVVLAYIDSLVDKKVLAELNNRLSRIKIDAVLDSGYIEELIEDAPHSIFPQIEHTERPDKACAAIFEGRIVILVDNTPFVLIVTTVFWQFLQAAGDYYERPYIGTYLRWLRLLALFISLTASAFYVMLVSYHQEMLPTVLALRIAAGREGRPFPAPIEAFLMEAMFEIMREAGLRMPKPVGQAVSIVGALVIGETAVNAGLVGHVLVIAVAASGISSFAIPAYDTSFAWRLAKYLLLFSTSVLGILGFLAGSILITLYLLSLRSFGAPFLAPINPFYRQGSKDTLFRAPLWAMNKRPVSLKETDKIRQGKNLKPDPNNNKDTVEEGDG